MAVGMIDPFFGNLTKSSSRAIGGNFNCYSSFLAICSLYFVKCIWAFTVLYVKTLKAVYLCWRCCLLSFWSYF